MTPPALIKICGTTSLEDARMAAHAGADFVGVIVEHAPSPRNVALDLAGRIGAAVAVPLVAVTVNLSLDRLLHIHEVLRPAVLQLHGDETPQLVRRITARGLRVWAVAAGEVTAVRQRALDLTEAGAEAILVDARATSAGGTVYGGTGRRSDWESARALVEAGGRVILAGGLTPQNVAPAVRAVRPWMVDVVSGVEARPGAKDPCKVHRFIEAVRGELKIEDGK
jgi:phosphoribosylanthranilate isomerase